MQVYLEYWSPYFYCLKNTEILKSVYPRILGFPYSLRIFSVYYKNTDSRIPQNTPVFSSLFRSVKYMEDETNKNPCQPAYSSVCRHGRNQCRLVEHTKQSNIVVPPSYHFTLHGTSLRSLESSHIKLGWMRIRCTDSCCTVSV